MSSSPPRSVSFTPIPGLPDFRSGDDPAPAIGDAMDADGLGLRDDDILVLAHKIVSKCEGRILRLDEIEPGARALELAEKLGKNPRKVEAILRETRRVLRAEWRPGKPEGVLICEHRLGFVSANAGVDESNTGEPGTVLLLPLDPDASADRIRAALETRFGVRIGVVIADSFGRPWRVGVVNVAIGVSGIPALVDIRGTPDLDGRTLAATLLAPADELAAGAGLVMGKADRTPVVLVRGLSFASRAGRAGELIRRQEEDLYR